MRRVLAAAVLVAVVGATPAWARPGWVRRIDRLVRGRNIGVALSAQGQPLYRHKAYRGRVPASNQKLVMTMALFDELGTGFRLRTAAAARSRRGGTIPGNLWILGTGDPTVTGGGRYGDALPMRPTRIGVLAARIKRTGVRRIRGRVMGATGYFSHDWWAPGWERDFPAEEVPLPSALSFEGNVHKGRHTRIPEKLAAKALTVRLEAAGIAVGGRPGSGRPPGGLEPVARALSSSSARLARYMNRSSSNFFAEVLGKRLGVARFGRPGTISRGARAVRRWAAAHGVDIDARDSSGLSYRNRVSPRGMVRLLQEARRAPWGPRLRAGLPAGGEGTLGDRLGGVVLRAKTGTLDEVSALSGWVWLERARSWAEFSIMSRGMPKYRAAAIEDRIVTIASNRARVPRPAGAAPDTFGSVVDLLLAVTASAGAGVSGG
jgi:serine-type D-Ala-D-Ala carboxypeptidase/endopeptidase (penicillin-binding protein 4)